MAFAKFAKNNTLVSAQSMPTRYLHASTTKLDLQIDEIESNPINKNSEYRSINPKTTEQAFNEEQSHTWCRCS